jgi:hypothetical protein
LRAQLGPAHAGGSFHRRVARVTKPRGRGRARMLNIDPIVFVKIFM